MPPAVGILVFLVAVLVLLVVGATFLRAAVALANRTIGPVRQTASLAWDWEAAEDDDDLEELRRQSRALPEPGLGRGMAVVLVVGVVQLLLGVVLEGAFDLDDARMHGDAGEWVPLHLLGLAVGFAVMTGVVASMLPTTGRRAALASFYFYLISVAVLGLVVGVIAFVLRSLGP